jgi:hypothetical protein
MMAKAGLGRGPEHERRLRRGRCATWAGLTEAAPVHDAVALDEHEGSARDGKAAQVLADIRVDSCVGIWPGGSINRHGGSARR